jgi:hypothetical protein
LPDLPIVEVDFVGAAFMRSADADPNSDPDDLVNEPRETLDVAVKEWLGLTDKDLSRRNALQ